MFRLNIARTMSKMPQSFDLVGPPCPRSHLRPIKLVKLPVESKLQEQYRRARLDLHSWNQAFWATHNTAFVKVKQIGTIDDKITNRFIFHWIYLFQERELFIAAKSKGETKTLNADEMSIFYKAFLDKNWKTHVNYNVQWYKKNMLLFMLSMKVGLENIVSKFKLWYIEYIFIYNFTALYNILILITINIIWIYVIVL